MIECSHILDLPPSANSLQGLFDHQREGAFCLSCLKPIPLSKQSSAIYCSAKCKRREKKKRYKQKHGFRKDFYNKCVCGNRKSRTSKRCADCFMRLKKPKELKPRKPLFEMVCPVCKTKFKQKAIIQKYCSGKCKCKSVRSANPDKAKEWQRRGRLKQEAKPFYKVAKSIRTRLREALKLNLINKTRKTFDMLGYTHDELVNHIERQFVFGMSWNNYGTEWHIDHIVPVSHHKFKSDDDVARCWRLSNLQPRFATNAISAKYGSFMEGNIEKGNRYIG